MTQPTLTLVGRELEKQRITACLALGRNTLLEGPVGVGKTFLALAVLAANKRKVYRIDGDSRYTEQKMTGWFDPPMALKKGYSEKTFIPGPLVQAMKAGAVLFINELNRLPEGVQNVLLPAIDERRVEIPRLGTIKAKPGFQVVATQNPKEFVATSHLSEAILDRFELVVLNYQTEEEECAIVQKSSSRKLGSEQIQKVVHFVRATRSHPRLRRGASVRAAIAIAEFVAEFLKAGRSFEKALIEAALLSLPTRIELEHDAESELSVQEQWLEVMNELLGSLTPIATQKKK